MAMSVLMNSITVIYYVIIAYASFLIITNFIKSKTWQKEVLYIIVLVPFLLRLFRLK